MLHLKKNKKIDMIEPLRARFKNVYNKNHEVFETLQEKVFHWCVLVSSPFFEKMYRNNCFVENQTGKII